MKLPRMITTFLKARLLKVACARPADFVIGGEGDAYLRRWYIIPRNRVFNIYLHQLVRSDDDRALHDHPWASCSIILQDMYYEIMPGAHKIRKAGDVTFRRASQPHRLVKVGGADCWSLFLTGPKVRAWGFHCPQGWKHWKEFTAADDPGSIGAGCGEDA